MPTLYYIILYLFLNREVVHVVESAAPSCYAGFDYRLGHLSLLVVRRIDDDASQRVSLCRRKWLLIPKAESQTRPHVVQADPCRLVRGGGLRCRCLRVPFASATSICFWALAANNTPFVSVPGQFLKSGEYQRLEKRYFKRVQPHAR